MKRKRWSKKQAESKSLLNNKQVRDSIIADLEAKGYEKAQIEEKSKKLRMP